ncbi:hypothetical protein N7470_002714 [Penicillium chermesinum]|nr:hypothetical protein N7470_002714 [Penicillium chermesinum]
MATLDRLRTNSLEHIIYEQLELASPRVHLTWWIAGYSNRMPQGAQYTSGCGGYQEPRERVQFSVGTRKDDQFLIHRSMTYRSLRDARRDRGYTASVAFFEALWEGGVSHVFVNLGSDHPSILEAMVKGQKEKQGKFPRIITCPNEMVALSAADGYARLTGEPQAVIVHVDVGTQGLGAAVHNASCGRAPVLIFAGLSPYTIEGETRGSRTEYIHWIQDVPDQKQIVSQYCRFTGEIKSGKNVKQIVNRALQFATSDPKGPVYLMGAREVMEEEIQPYQLNPNVWGPVSPAALPAAGVELITSELAAAKNPPRGSECWIRVAVTCASLRTILLGSGLRYAGHELVKTADLILVIDCDVPWVPTQFQPADSAKIIHIDVDPLKQQMPVFYINAMATFRADSATALKQINQHIASNQSLQQFIQCEVNVNFGKVRQEEYQKRRQEIVDLAAIPDGGDGAPLNVSYLMAQVRKGCPADAIWAIEAVTLTHPVSDQISATLPNSWINCGGGGLGWSGGGALGIKFASDVQNGGPGKGKFVVQVVGDGTYLFSVPGSVYWISRRYNIPVLTIVLNNKGGMHHGGDLHISFAPTPDYAGIAKAAAGGELWAGRASTVAELAEQLPAAIQSVLSGQGAVLEAQLDGTVGKYRGGA